MKKLTNREFINNFQKIHDLWREFEMKKPKECEIVIEREKGGGETYDDGVNLRREQSLLQTPPDHFLVHIYCFGDP